MLSPVLCWFWTKTTEEIYVMFKPSVSAEVQDWITPLHVDVLNVTTPAERLERIMQRARELREQMGPRYLCSEQNRVRRLDGRVYLPRETISPSITRTKRKKAA